MNNQIEQISNNISEVTLEDVNKAFHQGIEEFHQNSSQHLERIKILINNLIYNIEYFQGMSKLVPKGNVDASQKLLELKRVLIYKDFFELQNLINAFIYQKIIMTYVHVDPQTGMREIRLFDNDIKNLSSTIVNSYGRTYAKLGYELQSHYQLLKNCQ